MKDQNNRNELKAIALKLRKQVLKMIYTAGSGHCGGSLSAVEIITALYFDQLRIDPENPGWEDRDRFIASKGHCAPLLYAALAERGFFPKEELLNLRKIGHFLQGHPDMKKVPGVDMSTGSLGLGLSVGIGMALAGKLSGKSYYVYVLMGCGEQQEGQVWEAAMAAVKFKLDHLIAFIDYNNVQLDGRTDQIMPLGDLAGKWRIFGWNVLEVDGHEPGKICGTIELARETRDNPTLILARTIKGKGVSFMEGKHEWHGKPLGDPEYTQAMAELEGAGHD
jgi:transketolase